MNKWYKYLSYYYLISNWSMNVYIPIRFTLTFILLLGISKNSATCRYKEPNEFVITAYI